MHNRDLINDYLKRASDRLLALDLFLKIKSWANAVRESQEVVEICIKALLRHLQIDPPRIHDVGSIVLANIDKFPIEEHDSVKKLVSISRTLRRDRELAFYGSEDLTPSEFYIEEDAVTAVDQAKFIYEFCSRFCKEK